MGYNETTLGIIWHASWILSLISVVLFSILATVRYLRGSNAAVYNARYTELQRMLLIHLEKPLSELQTTFVQKKFDLEILAQLAQKILRSVGGQSRERIHSFIHVLNLEEWIYARTQKGRARDRLAAIQLLGYLPYNSKQKQALKEILEREKKVQLRCMAAESLSRQGNLENFHIILGALQKNEGLSPLLIYDILRRFGASAIDQLIEAGTSKDTTLSVKNAVIRALGDIPLPKSRDALIEHCYSENNEICATAFLALAKVALPVANEVISHGAQHSYWKARMYTADCAKYAQSFPATDLQRLLDDGNWMVSIHAAEALYSYGEAGERILEMIAAQDTIAARRAASFLIEKG